MGRNWLVGVERISAGTAESRSCISAREYHHSHQNSGAIEARTGWRFILLAQLVDVLYALGGTFTWGIEISQPQSLHPFLELESRLDQ